MPPSPSTPRMSKRAILSGVFSTMCASSSCSKGLRLRRLHRQEQRKGSAFADLGVHLDAPAVFLHDLVCNGKPEPGALSHFLGGEERVEDLGENAVGNAVTVVGDIDSHLSVAGHAGGDGNLSGVVVGGLRSVGDQVQKHLIDL